MSVPGITKPVVASITGDLKQEHLEHQIGTVLRDSGYDNLSEVSDCLFSIDLSQSYWYEIGALLWLLLLLHRFKGYGNDVRLLLPDRKSKKGDDTWSFLQRWRFFQALAECVDDPLQILDPHQVPLLGIPGRYSPAWQETETGEELVLHSSRLLEITPYSLNSRDRSAPEDPVGYFLGKFSERVVINALSSLCGWDRGEAHTFVQNVIGEGVRNCSIHGNGTFLIVAMRVDARQLTLAIADNGNGIPVSIRANFASITSMSAKSDAELIRLFTDSDFLLESYAILLSVRPGITTVPGRSGMGLHYLKNTVLNHGGELRIRSGTACVDFQKKDDELKDDLLLSPGTLIRIRTPLVR
jgi:Histidine kinase-, DNA gyrase B-, and HSP90-like ATPase